MLPTTPPQLFGQRIFGDLPSFSSVLFTLDVPSQIDSWLSLTPGTTIYGTAPGGRTWGFEGVFIEKYPDDVRNDIAILQGFAGCCGALGLSTGFAWPGDYRLYRNCRYVSDELAIGTILPSPGTQYRAGYRLVMRQVSDG